MKKQIITGYIISVLFILWALVKGNFEFIAYAGAVLAILTMLHYFDNKFNFSNFALWGFNAWILMHIFGGLFEINGTALYNLILVPIIGEPYLILKYDQVVHVFCYFIFALLMWSIVNKIADKKSSFGIMAAITVMAATGIGGLNEVIEFITTLFFDNNVGGYVNTALDIVSNLVGAAIAVFFFRKE